MIKPEDYPYDKSDQFYTKPEGLVLCGCMGPVEGEPLCPCAMARAGLPLSKSHVKANEKFREEIKTWFEEGGIFATK